MLALNADARAGRCAARISWSSCPERAHLFEEPGALEAVAAAAADWFSGHLTAVPLAHVGGT